MVDLFCGEAWANCRGHEISAQCQQPPHTYHKWREKLLGSKNLNSPFIPNMLHRSGVEDCFDELPRMAHFIWMIAWVKESLIGNKTSHDFHPSYLEEAIEQQGDFHLHLLLSHDVYFGFTHLEGYMEERFIAHFDELWWGLLMRRPQEEEEFFSTLQLLEDKKHVAGEDCNVPNF